MRFTVNGRDLLKDRRTLVMGVLNVTPDSFSDGGRFLGTEAALHRAEEMLAEGADIIDVGGESSRPGAAGISEQEELDRTIPVIEALKNFVPCISIDTVKSPVAKEAFTAGAHILNDISGFRHDPAMAAAVAENGASAVLMHMQGRPRDMQRNPQYDDLHAEIIRFLSDTVEAAERAGISPDAIAVDPGIGFGKTLEHNLDILRSLHLYLSIGKALLIGVSRKSFIEKIDGSPVTDRLEGSLAAVAIACQKGAHIFRVHDVRSCRKVLNVAERLRD